MNWDWRSDVADIDREEALENLATLYDGLIAKYDHLVLAYNVLVQMYGVSGLTDRVSPQLVPFNLKITQPMCKMIFVLAEKC
jgi:hypothetical protein